MTQHLSVLESMHRLDLSKSVHVLHVLILFLGILLSSSASATQPHDYFSSNYDQQLLRNVEKHHIPPLINELKEERWKQAWGSVDFILRYFPNHPRGLYLLTKLAIKTKNIGKAEQYFNKAIRLYPNTPTTHQIYGIMLQKIDKLDLAIEQYRKGVRLAPNNAEIHYNLGLAYLEKGDLVKAEEHARTAYNIGYPLPGLKNKLKEKDHWQSKQRP